MRFAPRQWVSGSVGVAAPAGPLSAPCRTRIARARWPSAECGGFGEPASGVTRTAYELALADPTGRTVLAPRPTDGLRIAVTELEVLSRLRPLTRLLLWLDNIADHSTDGLNRSLLDQCREESPAAGYRHNPLVRLPILADGSIRTCNILRRPSPGFGLGGHAPSLSVHGPRKSEPSARVLPPGQLRRQE